MKKIFLVLLSIVVLGCKEKGFGYLYDLDSGLPIENVMIIDVKNSINVKTDKSGYFEIIYEKVYPDELIFEKLNYETETIPAHGCSNAGETSNSCFRGQRIYLKKKIQKPK